MIHRILRGSLALAVTLALIVPTLPVLACGPWPILAVLTDPRNPDGPPYTNFFSGRLGIVQPSYRNIFLYAAYRQLVGAQFSAEELATFEQVATPELATTAEQNSTNGARKPEATIRSESRDGQYIAYYNCLPDAFETAEKTLEARTEQFGMDSAAVQSWQAAQDQVFANCGGPNHFNDAPAPVILPAVATDADPPLIRADRSYQFASAYFYAEEYDKAFEKFSAIAQDNESPWAGIAPYLAARALIRKAAIEDDKDALAQAEIILKKVLADPKRAAFRDAAERRLNYVSARLHPEARRTELGQKLLQPGTGKGFQQELTDYFWLLDRSATNAAAEDDLTRWMSVIKDNSPSAEDKAISRWTTSHSLPWLVAALVNATPDRPEISALISAAEKVPENSPASDTVRYHRLRLLAKQGNAVAAIAGLDQVLGQGFSSKPQSTQNQFLSLRMSLARNLEEFLKFAPRVPAEYVVDDGSIFGPSKLQPQPPDSSNQVRDLSASIFDADAATVLSEKLPLSLLAESAESNTLPPGLRRSVALAAWTKAAVLQDGASAKRLSKSVIALWPELATAFEPYAAATTPESRAFAAAFVILHVPGARPFIEMIGGRDDPPGTLDDFRNNWWCSLAPTQSQDRPATPNYPWRNFSRALRQLYPNDTSVQPVFLSAAQQKAATDELAKLVGSPASANWLGEQVLSYARSNPADPHVPEALHLVVRSWRYGCAQNDGLNYSKEAFELLHKRYPSSEWTQKTPYWFN